MTEFYYIPRWRDTFENSQSRQLVRPLTWVAVPTGHDSAEYGRVTRHEHAAELLGAWLLIIQTAAKCPVRGALATDRGPLTPDDLEFATRVPQAAFEQAFAVLADPKIGWLAIGRSEDDDGPGLLDACLAAVSASATVVAGSTTAAAGSATGVAGSTTEVAGSADIPRRSGLQGKTGPVGPVRSGMVLTREDRSGRTGPEFLIKDSAGPDRGCNGNGVDQVFRLTFFTRLADAFGWNSDEAMNQRRSLLAVARKFEREPTEQRDEVAEGLIALAKEKVAAGLDRPVAAWQKEANRWFEPARAPPEHRKHAVG